MKMNRNAAKINFRKKSKDNEENMKKLFVLAALLGLGMIPELANADCVAERFSISTGAILQTYRGVDGASNCRETYAYCEKDTNYRGSSEGCKKPEDTLYVAHSRFTLWHRGAYINSFSSSSYYTDRTWAERDAHAQASLACSNERTRLAYLTNDPLQYEDESECRE
jgi:hypothetical protein